MAGEGTLTIAIVGAGIHGCAVAVRLLSEWPELRSGLRLIDPAGTCLADWSRRTWGQGMETMRSPGAHHLDVPSASLVEFARTRGRERELRTPYARPSLQLFMDHSRLVLAKFRIEELVTPTRVEAVEPLASGYRLQCADGSARPARWLILAPGLAGHERLPEWAGALARSHPGLVAHVEHVDIRRKDLVGQRILVVGGGLSAATLADAAVERGARMILLSRHRLEARLFDVDSGWIGPKYLSLFQQESDPEARLRMIRRARGHAAVTPELLERLRVHEAERRLEVREGDEIASVNVAAGGRALLVRFQRGIHDAHRIDRVWCATGARPCLDTLRWLGPLGDAPRCDGRPVVGPTLELRPACFVSGWLAELWVGPAARNISGARHAAGRIAEALRERLGRRHSLPDAA